MTLSESIWITGVYHGWHVYSHRNEREPFAFTLVQELEVYDNERT